MQACEMPVLRLFSNIDRNYLCTQWKSRVPGEVDLYVLSKFWCFFVCLSVCLFVCESLCPRKVSLN